MTDYTLSLVSPFSKSSNLEMSWGPPNTGESNKQEKLVCTGTSPVKTRENLGRDFAETYVLLK